MKVPSKYQAQADNAYKALANPMFCGSRDYWKIGNAFDTMTDYLLTSEIELDGTNVLNAYKEAQSSAVWYDDFSWWAIACSKAFDPTYAKVFGPQKSQFQQVAVDCWNTVERGAGINIPPYIYSGAPNVWPNSQFVQNNSPTDYYETTKPRFVGGVWQYEMFYQTRDGDRSPSNPSDPFTEELGPFQLTVMNALYLVLALRLQQLKVDKTPDAPAAADRQYKFLSQWMFLNEPDHALLRPLGKGKLVRERVATYAQLPDKSFPLVYKYYKDATWFGDQGLMLAAMADYHALHPTDQTSEDVAVQLLWGAVAAFWNQFTHKATPVKSTTDGWPHGDPEDYQFGEGVFMRGLLHAFNRNASVQKAILSTNFLDNFIVASAEHACTVPLTGTGETALCEAFNVLSILTAAIQIIKLK
jgi:hypothetical protein